MDDKSRNWVLTQGAFASKFANLGRFAHHYWFVWGSEALLGIILIYDVNL
jgi:hypothetical protein